MVVFRYSDFACFIGQLLTSMERAPVTEAGTELVGNAMTATSMLGRMNKILEESGGSVQMKRKGDHPGVFHDVSKKEMQHTDSVMKMKAVGDSLKNLSRKDKLTCCIDMKESGNTLYNEGDYTGAIDMYLQCLMGLDFGETEEEKQSAVSLLQVPALLNMAACLLHTKEYEKVVLMCDQALDACPGNVKALCRRGMAAMYLHNFRQAREDLREALLCGKSPQDLANARRGLRQLQGAEQVYRHQRAAKKAKTEKLLRRGVLYQDKEEVGSSSLPDVLSVPQKQKPPTTSTASASTAAATGDSAGGSVTEKQPNVASAADTSGASGGLAPVDVPTVLMLGSACVVLAAALIFGVIPVLLRHRQGGGDDGAEWRSEQQADYFSSNSS